MRRLLIMATVGLVGAACAGGSTGPDVANARIGEPTGPNAAMYFIASATEPDRLVGATTDVAASVEIHESVVNDDGTLGMTHLHGLDVGPDDPLVLEPGGFHLMLVDVDRLEPGATIQITLEWEDAGEMTVDADVVDPGATAG